MYSLSLVNEVMDGIKIYFDFMLKDHLLYMEEKDQYDLVMSRKSQMAPNYIEDAETVDENEMSLTPSSIYGATHLLRLFGMCK